MPKLLVWMDPLSRWVEAVPLKKDPTSAELLDMFMTFVVSRHGFPQSVRSDRGSYLVSDLVQELYRTCRIRMADSTAYNHQSVGMIERFNATFTEMLRAALQTPGAPQDWVDHMDYLLFAYRSTVNAHALAGCATRLARRRRRRVQKVVIAVRVRKRVLLLEALPRIVCRR